MNILLEFSVSFMLVDLYLIFQFYFSCSGWGIGPSGGVVEPDLVAKMRSDEGSGGNFFYGPAVMVPHREPFAYERYLFGQYHDCGKYAELEKKFFSENEESVRFSLIQIIFLAWIQMKTLMKLFQ